MKNDRNRRNDAPQHRLNEDVRGEQVIITNLQDWEDEIDIESYKGIRHRQVALDLAEELGSDLIEVGQANGATLCKILEYSKFLYQQKRAEKEKKRQNSGNEMKEVRMTPGIADGDLEVKTRQIREFLETGHPVKVGMFFKGRELYVRRDDGERKLLEIAQSMEDCGRLSGMPKLEGKRMSLMITPKSRK